MNKTKIEWVKNPDGSQGYTWNPITGCLNGCEYCYARKLANGRLKYKYLANSILPTHAEPNHQAHHNDPFYPRFWPSRLDKLNPIYGQDTRSKVKGIFVCDMADLFGIGIPKEWTKKVLGRINEYPYHRFYLLTKQPQNLIEFSPFPDNCWVGVTVTDYDRFIEACGNLGALRHKHGTMAYISFEPLLSWDSSPGFTLSWLLHGEIPWVIIGAQTNPYKPPKIEWIREIVEACDKAGIQVFLKDNLRKAILFTEDNAFMFQSIPGVPTGFKLRQEMPTIH